MGSIANKRAKEIFSAHMGTFVAVGLLYSLINYMRDLIEEKADFFVISLIVALLASLVRASSCFFFFRAFNRGAPDTADITGLFYLKDSFSKILPIVLVNFIINAFASLVSALFEDTFIVGILILLGISVLEILFVAVWYLFTANPQYQTADYFKASVRYMGQHLWGYIGFVLLHILLVIAVIFMGLMIPVLGWIFIVVFAAVYLSFLDLAIAGYIAQIIPDEWYAGTAVF